MPLVNEVVIPLGKKDRFNASEPAHDAQFLGHVMTPELASLIPVLYPGVKVPTEVDAGLGLGGREDIATIFLTGIPGVNQPTERQAVGDAPAQHRDRPVGLPERADADRRRRRHRDPGPGRGHGVHARSSTCSPNKDLSDGVDANDVPFTGHVPVPGRPGQRVRQLMALASCRLSGGPPGPPRGRAVPPCRAPRSAGARGVAASALLVAGVVVAAVRPDPTLDLGAAAGAAVPPPPTGPRSHRRSSRPAPRRPDRPAGGQELSRRYLQQAIRTSDPAYYDLDPPLARPRAALAPGTTPPR